jgi:AcrR family transcriptional regulator
MGRIATFDDKTVYKAVGRELAVNGQATITSIQKATGLSAGSLYHRFGSREGLMAEAWLYTISAFQSRIAVGFAVGGLEGAAEIALATPQFCRDEPELAMLLVCGRPSEFMAAGASRKQKTALEALNLGAAQGMSALARQLGRDLLECRMALVAFPLGAVRAFLPHHKVPRSVDEVIRKAVCAILGPASSI